MYRHKRMRFVVMPWLKKTLGYYFVSDLNRVNAGIKSFVKIKNIFCVLNKNNWGDLGLEDWHSHLKSSLQAEFKES